MRKLTTMFLILLTVASCRSGFPRIKPQLACSIVLREKDGLYEADCRCAKYDLENTIYIEEFKKSPIEYCDRGHIFPREVWEVEIEPYADEVREYLEDTQEDLIQPHVFEEYDDFDV